MRNKNNWFSTWWKVIRTVDMQPGHSKIQLLQKIFNKKKRRKELFPFFPFFMYVRRITKSAAGTQSLRCCEDAETVINMSEWSTNYFLSCWRWLGRWKPQCRYEFDMLFFSCPFRLHLFFKCIIAREIVICKLYLAIDVLAGNCWLCFISWLSKSSLFASCTNPS